MIYQELALAPHLSVMENILLGIAATARDFAALGDAGRLVAGTELPAPSGVFPRYVEPEAGEGA